MKTKTIKMFNTNDGTTYKLWSECGCGCGEIVRNMFAQGHDMKLQSKLIAAAKLLQENA